MQRGRKNHAALNAIARAWALVEDPVDPFRELGESSDAALAALSCLEAAIIAILDEEKIRLEASLTSIRVKLMIAKASKKKEKTTANSRVR